MLISVVRKLFNKVSRLIKFIITLKLFVNILLRYVAL